MDNGIIGRVLCFLSIRDYLITLPSKELINLVYLDKEGKQDTECTYSFFNIISFLLCNEEYYPYLGEDILNKIYVALSYVRNIITEDRDKLCNFINNLIVKLNSVHNNNYDEKRKKYLMSELFIRTGESWNDYEDSLDLMETLLIEYIKYDLVVFNNIFGNNSDDIFVVNDSNVMFMISSLSYYCTYLTSILDDEEILKLIVYIKYVLDYANCRQFSEKHINKSVFEGHKRVLKRIQSVLEQKIISANISDKDINKLKIKAKASIN